MARANYIYIIQTHFINYYAFTVKYEMESFLDSFGDNPEFPISIFRVKDGGWDATMKDITGDYFEDESASESSSEPLAY